MIYMRKCTLFRFGIQTFEGLIFEGFFFFISLRTSGEANAHKPDTYKCTFPTMIDDWRKKFSAASGTTPNFPFGFVQVQYYYF